jgi:hypothetical protein
VAVDWPFPTTQPTTFEGAIALLDYFAEVTKRLEQCRESAQHCERAGSLAVTL